MDEKRIKKEKTTLITRLYYVRETDGIYMSSFFAGTKSNKSPWSQLWVLAILILSNPFGLGLVGWLIPQDENKILKKKTKQSEVKKDTDDLARKT